VNQATARLDSIYAGLKQDLEPNWFGSAALGAAWSLYLRGTLRDAFVGAIGQALNDQNLLSNFVEKWPLKGGQKNALDAQAAHLKEGAKSSVLAKDDKNWILTTVWP
jgi:hypothetical protein